MNCPFKVGDKVRVKSAEYFKNHPNYDEYNKEVKFGSIFTHRMFAFCGKVFIVAQINEREHSGVSFIIYLKPEDTGYRFNEYMLEKFEQLEFDF